jgi:predicted aspartyl protease
MLAVFLPLFLASENVSAAAKKLNLDGYEQLPLERGSQNHLLLHAKVNGQPAVFVIDTCAARTFLRSDRAKKFGIRGAEGNAESSASIDLSASSKLFGRITVAVYDPSQRAGYLPADGAIGLDLLRRYKAVINCRSREIFLRSDSSPLLDLTRTTAAKGFVRVPIGETAHGYLRVLCRIHGKIGRLLLDTGAFVTVLEQRAIYALGINGNRLGMTAGGFDGQVRSLELAQIDDLKIGTVPIPPQKLALMNILPEHASRKSLMLGFNRVAASEHWGASSEPFFGLLGNDLLDYQQAIIDLGSMSLFLK